MKKLVFFDVDDTLVCHHDLGSRILTSTRVAIQKLKENNHVVALATGRGLVHVETIADDLNIEDFVLLNGNHVIAKNESIFEQYLDQDIQESLKKYIDETKCVTLAFDLENVYLKDYQSRLEQYMSAQLHYGTKDFDVNKHFLTLDEARGKLSSISVFTQDIDLKPYEERCDIKPWGEQAFEFNMKGISKLHGIEVLAKHYGVDMNHVYVFGDNYNDIEMLAGVKHSVCMGNGVEPAKEAASFVTKSSCEDGIAHALKHFELI